MGLALDEPSVKIKQSIADVKSLETLMSTDIDIEVKDLLYDLANKIIKRSIEKEILNGK